MPPETKPSEWSAFTAGVIAALRSLHPDLTFVVNNNTTRVLWTGKAVLHLRNTRMKGAVHIVLRKYQPEAPVPEIPADILHLVGDEWMVKTGDQNAASLAASAHVSCVKARLLARAQATRAREPKVKKAARR